MGALLMCVLPPLLFPLISAHVDMQMASNASRPSLRPRAYAARVYALAMH